MAEILAANGAIQPTIPEPCIHSAFGVRDRPQLRRPKCVRRGVFSCAVLVLSILSASASMAQNGTPVSQRVFDRDSAWNNNYSTGRALFEEHCSGCHGEHGRGGLGLPLNLQSFLIIADTGYLIRSMRYGRPIRKMPAFDKDLTPKQMRAMITRAGPGTKIICMGNIAQIDTPYLTETTSGLTYVVDRFKRWEHSGHVTLVRGERSRLADYATEVL